MVLVELDMPGMDGIEFIGHIAQRKVAQAAVLASASDLALLNTAQRLALAVNERCPG